MWSLVDDILHIDNSAAAIPYPIAYEVAALFQFSQLCGYPIHTVLANFRKPSCGIVPTFGEGQHRGKKSPNLEEACGDYGEKIVLRAQQLGLNTCWVAMTYSKVKTAFQIAPGEKLCLVIAVGHGTTQGAGHPVKQPEEVSKADSPVPDWFQRGVRAALLAPTAMNQQKFTFTLQGGSVAAKAGAGFYTKVDLGIAKYHFEIGVGTAQFRWAP